MSRTLSDAELADFQKTVECPGKFEGEQPWCPYFYEGVLAGGDEPLWSDPDGGGAADGVTIDQDDRDNFPELGDSYGAILHTRSDGFVQCTLYDTQSEYEAACEQWTVLDTDQQENDA